MFVLEMGGWSVTMGIQVVRLFGRVSVVSAALFLLLRMDLRRATLSEPVP